MKFVHSADIHLDSPLRGLERYEGAPVEEIRGATRGALRNLAPLLVEDADRHAARRSYAPDCTGQKSSNVSLADSGRRLAHY